ncbi:LOW QUALITY PROTEIN: Cleavage induced protein [Phytophthora megakarya]|uniref:Cleavage induced protein n=1 Tax=Phytophthora megakarya TaxID=4795 RepID=A0A225W7Q1_9STRA|nr:LOW QUALITY PROTEIN: Cleavage induced protein [Phytophthora megakarya]
MQQQAGYHGRRNFDLAQGHKVASHPLEAQGDFVAHLAKFQARCFLTQTIAPTGFLPTTRPNTEPARYELDRSKQAAYSAYLRRSSTQLADLLRGERGSDSVPNKTLQVPSEDPSWSSYRLTSHWVDFFQHGVLPNHGSAHQALNVLVKNIKKVKTRTATMSSTLTCPFGAVPKGDRSMSEDARVIHDLSFPRGESINEFSVPKDKIDISSDGAWAIASRIEEVVREFLGLSRMMSGDGSRAFCHTRLHAVHCCKFAGTIFEFGVLVVDLCCPFGCETHRHCTLSLVGPLSICTRRRNRAGQDNLRAEPRL